MGSTDLVWKTLSLFPKSFVCFGEAPTRAYVLDNRFLTDVPCPVTLTEHYCYSYCSSSVAVYSVLLIRL